MGYRPPVTTVNVDWPEGHRLHGLHVKARSVTVDEYHDIVRLMFGDPNAEPLADDMRQRAAQIAKANTDRADTDDLLMKEFADRLIEWDYEDPTTGEPLPPTREGIGRAEPGLMAEIIGGWVNALVSVPSPLPTTSPNGRTPSDSEESALGLADVSTSPAS